MFALIRQLICLGPRDHPDRGEAAVPRDQRRRRPKRSTQSGPLAGAQLEPIVIPQRTTHEAADARAKICAPTSAPWLDVEASGDGHVRDVSRKFIAEANRLAFPDEMSC